jgi:adenosylcobinamide kinase / adenosylcobinamide-phosphate guanylyltransferase
MTEESIELPSVPHLVLGGARSGKSAYAETLMAQYPAPYVYLATAQVLDAEMAERVSAHRKRRGPAWQTIEAPLDLIAHLNRLKGSGQAVLVDCLTLWLTNLILEPSALSTAAEEQVAELCGVIRSIDAPLVLVANEVGSGIVPENALARRFRDLAGRTNQQVAAACAGVTLVVAGLPLRLKGNPPA